MVTLECSVAERGGVSLVECRVENDGPDDRRVRVASLLDGPVWPPRREGVPEAGWDDGGYEGTVAAGETVALGFASPAPPVDPPAEVAWTERSAAAGGTAPPGDQRPPRRRQGGGGGGAGGGGDGSASDRGDSGSDDADDATGVHDRTAGAVDDRTTGGPAVDTAPDETTPADVVRALGDPRPPADAVPLPDPDDGGETVRSDEGDGDEVGEIVDGGAPVADDSDLAATVPAGLTAARAGPAVAPATDADDSPARATDTGVDADATVDSEAAADGDDPPDDDLPDPVAAWMGAVAARVERGEALAAADGLTDAARGLDATGGVDGAAALTATLDADARRLRRVAGRAGALAARAEAATEAPVDTLRRLA